MEQGISIEKDGDILAHHTTETCLSHYGQPVWVIENDDPPPGCVIWRQGEREEKLDFLGVVDGWFVAVQSDGKLVGIIWSDGNYYANLIENTETGQVAEKTTIKQIEEGCYQVRGTVPIGGIGCICL